MEGELSRVISPKNPVVKPHPGADEKQGIDLFTFQRPGKEAEKTGLVNGQAATQGLLRVVGYPLVSLPSKIQ